VQSLSELKVRTEKIELYSYSTNEDRCDNCRYYKLMREGIGYCSHREVDMVVGAPWWCKLWEPDAVTAKARQRA
jgi:High potential iron-sulfur protein